MKKYVVMIMSLILISSVSAHILIIADTRGDFPEAYNEAKEIANNLKSNGYKILELYRENATLKNVLKGMYLADGIIYIGHGGYMEGNYDNVSRIAKPPFGLVCYDGFIFGTDDGKLKINDTNITFYPPFKSGIPVILIHTCFSTGWVDDVELTNTIETIYHFSKMFTSSGANYYASAWEYGGGIIDAFLQGARTFKEANEMNYEQIKESQIYNGTIIWRNQHGYACFVGNWDGKFPMPSEVTPYNDIEAEKWYNRLFSNSSNESVDYPLFSIILSNVGKTILPIKYYASVYTNPVNGEKVMYREYSYTLQPGSYVNITLGRFPKNYAVSTTIVTYNKNTKTINMELQERFEIEGSNGQKVVISKYLRPKSLLTYTSRFTDKGGVVDIW
ncbi:hypothetical protein Mfer_0374 [Methanothermus fervidus DSM 2088]|uniref:Uncharacterized protein n=1 Tax=Methanothermus fervidus (strain ATCC 43054 / DSM 2088 / JCM 10308 / V24 S) TaxID=523846 RepID=E3GXZ4_METFV|nr:hypothetical protein [Methanothermus fervidus]ADP77176.1 hypothetical protein Mfer_0374 [Methanothermus fervidus DSM 2088]